MQQLKSIKANQCKTFPSWSLENDAGFWRKIAYSDRWVCNQTKLSYLYVDFGLVDSLIHFSLYAEIKKLLLLL